MTKELIKSELIVKETKMSVIRVGNEEYISLTDMARYRDTRTEVVLQNWIRNRMTIEYLGLWEKLHNTGFKHIEFDVFKNQAGLTGFVLSPKQWIEKTDAIGIISKSGRYGGTFAHPNIAFKFAAWISPEFELYLISEFERLKRDESYRNKLDWSVKRELAKTNYLIHTDAISVGSDRSLFECPLDILSTLAPFRVQVPFCLSPEKRVSVNTLST